MKQYLEAIWSKRSSILNLLEKRRGVKTAIGLYGFKSREDLVEKADEVVGLDFCDLKSKLARLKGRMLQKLFCKESCRTIQDGRATTACW